MSGRGNQPDNPATARGPFAPWTDPAAQPLVRFEAVSKRFAGVTAVDARVARHLPGRVLCAARAVRLRQDHAAAHARRLRDAGRGPRPARRQGPHRRAAAPPAGQHDVPELRAVPASHRRGQRRVRAQAGRPAEGRDRRAHRRDAGAAAARRASRRASRISFPAASASASRWRARWSSGRACCCSTSRSRRSTRSCAARRSSN